MGNVSKIRRSIFFIIVISLMFITIPKYLHFPVWGLGSFLTSKLVVYPIYAGIIFELYLAYKNRKNISFDLTGETRFLLAYIGIYFLVILVSVIHGMAIYPFMAEVLKGPSPIEKLPAVLGFLNSHDIAVSSESLTKIWLVCRYLKGFLLSTLLSFGVVYLLFRWCRKDVKLYFRILVCGVVASVVIISLYCFIEIPYLAHYKCAEKILTFINPFLHEIKINGGWWPPLLWKNQIRSLFPEPSHFGIYAAFAMPFLWYAFIRLKSMKYKAAMAVLIAFYTFSLFLTSARTAFVLFIGEVGLLFIYTLYLHSKCIAKHVGVIMLISAVAFGTSLGFISYQVHPQAVNRLAQAKAKSNAATKDKTNVVAQKAKSNAATKDKANVVAQKAKSNAAAKDKANVAAQKAKSNAAAKDKANVAAKKSKVNASTKDKANAAAQYYIDSNLKSLTSTNQRSNASRFSVMRADFEVGLEHPLLGVGRNLRSPYVAKKLESYPKKSGEVKTWLKRMHSLGIMKAGIPTLGNYTVLFSETGVLGLLVWIFPPAYLLWHLLKLLWLDKSRLDVAFFLISFTGLLVAAIGDTINIFYSYWLLLGLGYAFLYDWKMAGKIEQGSESKS